MSRRFTRISSPKSITAKGIKEGEDWMGRLGVEIFIRSVREKKREGVDSRRDFVEAFISLSISIHCLKD